MCPNTMKPVIYLYFHSKIKEWKGDKVKEKEFRNCLFQWRIPKNLRYPIMKEMEKMGLIKIEKKVVYIQDYYFKQIDKKSDMVDNFSYMPFNKL